MEANGNTIENKEGDRRYCTICKVEVDKKYTCPECDKSMCVPCYDKVGHDHEENLAIETDLLKLNLNNASTSSSLKERQESIDKCVLSLVHASMCIDEGCVEPSCSKMKKVVGHLKICKAKVRGGRNCPVCSQFLAIYLFHARHCQLSQPQIEQNAMQQLTAVMQAPTRHDQQEKIMQILRANPQLMTAVMKRRQQQTRVAAPGPAPQQQQAQPQLDQKVVHELFDILNNQQPNGPIDACGVVGCAQLKRRMQLQRIQ